MHERLNSAETVLEMAAADSGDIWEKHAFQWNLIGPPLRPCAEDIQLLERIVAERCAGSAGTSVRALLLGVTPEIATMRWPPDTLLLALDCHLGMIKHVWPGSRSANAAAVCADWLNMPVSHGTCDVVVCDGSLSVLAYPEGYEALTRRLHNVLKRGGLFVVRAFVQSDIRESVEAVFDDLWAGRIGNFHICKWRLAMALQDDPAEGSSMAAVWEAWNDACPDRAAAAKRLNWPLPIIGTIEAARNSKTHYTFLTLAQLRQTLAPYFSELACFFPTYELGERCPTLVLMAR